MAVTVERWWNGLHGTVRRDVRLIRDGDRWHVEVWLGGRAGGRELSDPGNELWARRLLAGCMEAGGDGWRRVG